MTAPGAAHTPASVVPLVVVTAVKSLNAAKSRFAPQGDGLRGTVPELVLAMLEDTLAAATAVPQVIDSFVVSPDPDVLRAAVKAGARGVTEPDPGGLNAALRAGANAARAVHGTTIAVLALQPDLPGVSTDEVREFIIAAAGRRAFVPDHSGQGTAALLAPAQTDLLPAFGTNSALAHGEGGALALPGPWPGLRTDIDTPGDFAVLDSLGPRTAAVLARGDHGIASNSRR